MASPFFIIAFPQKPSLREGLGEASFYFKIFCPFWM